MEPPRPSPLRIYADTSVFGGCFDPPFIAGSRHFFRLVRRRQAIVLLSDVVVRELKGAPPWVQRILASLPDRAFREVEIDDEVTALGEAYLAAGVVGAECKDDTTHVAAATVAQADAIVSWNFWDIVGPGRIRGYNRVNLCRGYGVLTIVTPAEVLPDEH